MPRMIKVFAILSLALFMVTAGLFLQIVNDSVKNHQSLEREILQVCQKEEDLMGGDKMREFEKNTQYVALLTIEKSKRAQLQLLEKQPRSFLSVWISLALAWSASAVLMFSILRFWRFKKRLKSGFCVSCGYDLRAATDRCPECGSISAPQK